MEEIEKVTIWRELHRVRVEISKAKEQLFPDQQKLYPEERKPQDALDEIISELERLIRDLQ